MQTNDSQNQVNFTIKQPIKVIHFSDGVEEEIEGHDIGELKNSQMTEEIMDMNTLTWGPWFSHYIKKSGTKVLNAVDYAGESLATFFGITTPKYQIEINEYERVLDEKRKIEEESAGWMPKSSDGNIPLVLNEPLKEDTKLTLQH